MFEMRIYALYKDDRLIAEGTLAQIAKKQGVKESTISFYGSPTYQKRIKKSGLSLTLLEDTNGKECRVCEKILSLNSFYNKKGSKDGKQSDCKKCVTEAKKKWRSEMRMSDIHKQRDDAKNEWHNTLRILA